MTRARKRFPWFPLFVTIVVEALATAIVQLLTCFL